MRQCVVSVEVFRLCVEVLRECVVGVAFGFAFDGSNISKARLKNFKGVLKIFGCAWAAPLGLKGRQPAPHGAVANFSWAVQNFS